MRQYDKRHNEFRTCKHEKCNILPFLPKCYVCNSTKDLNCAINPSPSDMKFCWNYDSRCFSLISKDHVTRGCLDDSDTSIKLQCGIEDGRCDICSSPGCNGQKINMEKCVECYSSVDPRCRTHPELMKDKICAKFLPKKRNGCYLKIVSLNFPHYEYLNNKLNNFQEGDKVNRGCLQDLKLTNATHCIYNSDTCKSCTGTRCNERAKYQECYSCNGENEPQCAKNAELTNIETCRNYRSSCGIEIDEKGFTHRGCLNQASNFRKKLSNNTFICDEDNCNVEIFPKDRLKCYQCSGNEECNLDSIKPEPCTIYVKHDQCFTYLNKGEINHI